MCLANKRTMTGGMRQIYSYTWQHVQRVCSTAQISCLDACFPSGCYVLSRSEYPTMSRKGCLGIEIECSLCRSTVDWTPTMRHETKKQSPLLPLLTVVHSTQQYRIASWGTVRGLGHHYKLETQHAIRKQTTN